MFISGDIIVWNNKKTNIFSKFTFHEVIWSFN